jgi:hypothetical protein
MSLKLAQRFKVIGAYTEAQILSVTANLSAEEKTSAEETTKQIMKRLRNVDTSSMEQPKTKKLRKITAVQKLGSIIGRIENALGKYESSADVDNWKIKFRVGVKYERLRTTARLITFHRQLLKSAVHSEQVKLLISSERGRLYDYVKYADDYAGRWEDLCKELGVCCRSADRYIDFSRIVSGLPRLIICNLSFETIVGSYKELHDYLNENDSLRDRLAQPLKEIRIQQVSVFTADGLPTGDSSCPTELLSADADWSAAWQITDELEEAAGEDGQ